MTFKTTNSHVSESWELKEQASVLIHFLLGCLRHSLVFKCLIKQAHEVTKEGILHTPVVNPTRPQGE